MEFSELDNFHQEELVVLRKLLYRAVMELGYVQEMEDHSMCASEEGAAVIEEGMKFLGVKDLSEEELPARLLKI